MDSSRVMSTPLMGVMTQSPGGFLEWINLIVEEDRHSRRVNKKQESKDWSEKNQWYM